MNQDHDKVANAVLSRSRYINSEAAQIYDQYIDEGDYSYSNKSNICYFCAISS